MFPRVDSLLDGYPDWNLDGWNRFRFRHDSLMGELWFTQMALAQTTRMIVIEGLDMALTGQTVPHSMYRGH